MTSIGRTAFQSCSGLTSVTFGEDSKLDTIRDWTFNGCSALTSIDIPNTVTSIGKYAFQACSSMTSIEIPSGVTSIGNYAFNQCSALTNMEIPSTVTSIGRTAFQSCSGLTSVTFGEDSKLDTIGDHTFGQCSSLTSIDIPNTVTSIGEYAFQACSGLTAVTFGEDSQLTSIGNCAFSLCSNLTSIDIPSGVTSIGNYAFDKCSALTNIEIPSTVTSIGRTAFQSCSGLTSVTFGEDSKLDTIRDWTFNKCSALTSIDIPNTVTSIGEYAFQACSSMTSIEIPSTVTSIGEHAFGSCSSLASIRCLADSVPSTGENAFLRCPSDMIIYVKEASVDAYRIAEQWKDFTILPIAAAPTNLIAVPIETSAITLKWDWVENATAYKVYCNGKMLADATENWYNAKGLTYNTEYCFRVTAIIDGVESEKTESACATTFDLPITTPKNLVATPESTSTISLSWDAVENALSYNIYQDGELIGQLSESVSGSKSESKSGSESESGLSYLVENLDYYTEYCFTVTAVRNETETEKSESACATTFDLPITTPENLVATPESTSTISLSWDAAENALSYNIYQDGELIGQQSESVSGSKSESTVSYLVENLDYYTEYCFTVTAVRNETETEKSESACATTFDLPITTPENLVATPESTSTISLSWDAVENALSYNIYQDGELIGQQPTDNSQQSGSESESGLSYLVENLEYNTEYCFTVTAVRNETETKKSESACATTLGDGLGELSASFEIYPNPVSDKLYIDTDADTYFEVEIYNINGQQVYKTTRQQVCGQQPIDVSDLRSVVYLVRIKTANGDVVKRVVKL